MDKISSKPLKSWKITDFPTQICCTNLGDLGSQCAILEQIAYAIYDLKCVAFWDQTNRCNHVVLPRRRLKVAACGGLIMRLTQVFTSHAQFLDQVNANFSPI